MGFFSAADGVRNSGIASLAALWRLAVDGNYCALL